MRIVHYVAPAHAGGLERVIHALAIGQKRQGDDVLVVPVIDAWSGEHPFAGPLVRAGVELCPIVVPGRAYLRERAELARVLAGFRPDVVHTHGYHADVVGGAVARAAGAASVSTAHGFTRGPLKNRIYEWLCRRAFRRFDAIAAVSRPLARELEDSGVPSERVHVVPNAWSWINEPLGRLEARAALGLDARAPVVGWVGRMSPEKGLDVMLDAMPVLGGLGVVLCAVGDGPERAPQTARAQALGVADRVRWPGMVREAGKYFRAFDVLVISSRTEGIPMVLLEAFASGIPVVATAVGGIPEVASPAEARLIAPERPDELASAIRSALTEPEATAARTRAAQARLEREFDERAWLDRYAAVYRSAIASQRSGGRPRPGPTAAGAKAG